MEGIRIVTVLGEAERLWRERVPPETVFDLWEVREAFHRHYRRPPRFVVGEAGAFLPLSWIEEKSAWGFFPGETWAGKTWIEQNRILAGPGGALELAASQGGDYHLRYLVASEALGPEPVVDETGYLFHPARYDYDIENWWAEFQGKKAKNLRREIAALMERGGELRHGEEHLFDLLVEMNISRFGDTSYFADARFREGFRDMLAALSRMGLLRVTTVYLEGIPAAVDFGSVYRGRYTLLAGGTDARFPGVAKLINLHHIEWACQERLDEVDFLCGDFKWKPLFRLEPRPLYLLSSLPKPAEHPEPAAQDGESAQPPEPHPAPTVCAHAG